MRTARVNRQRMYYSLWLENQPVYDLDRDGNIRYDDDGDPIETGGYRNMYSHPLDQQAGNKYIT